MTRKRAKKAKNRRKNRPPLPVGSAALRYDAASADRSRRTPYVSYKSEDREQTPRERQTIISDARDQQRNFSLAGFVVRKHLQSIAYYRFSANTPNTPFNRQLERRIDFWKRRGNCDASGRHGFDQLITLIEYHRAVDGDVGLLTLSNNKIQLIEGDRIRNGPGHEISENWVHGVKVNDYGTALAYAVSKRTAYGAFEHERIIPARNMFLLGYYTRKDQIRGVSLHAPAANMFAKLYESIDLALAKQKLEQCLGLATILEVPDIYDEDHYANYVTRRDAINRRVIDSFGPGLTNVELATGEDIKAFESNNPSDNFQSFVEQVLRMVFAAYDIPYSFFDGSKTNYYGSEGEFEQYIDSVEKKQQPTIEILNEMTFDWLLPNWLIDPNDPLELPAGWTKEDVAQDCEWTGAGLPSWRLFRHIKDLLPAISCGMIGPSYAAGEYGHNIRKNIDDMAAIIAYGREKGISLPFGQTINQNIGM